MTTATNKSLNKAKSAKNDEFYTQLSDIANELRYYKDQFRGKVVYCNCDDPKVSNFFKYFAQNFRELGLKKLITTCYKSQDRDMFSTGDSEKAMYLEYNGTRNENGMPDDDEIVSYELEGDGDFRSAECVELLKQADVVVTNPPFSLFREYVAQLVEYGKDFLIVGNMNAITYKEIFPLIKSEKIWLGINNGPKKFEVPDSYSAPSKKGIIYENGKRFSKLGNVNWFTNLDYAKRHEDLILYRRYSSNEYATYDNYDAINVDKVSDVPMDYDGAMGVPISFLSKLNPDQFEIVKFRKGDDDKDLSINSKPKYFRIVIRNKRLQSKARA